MSTTEENPAEMIARLEHQLVNGPQGHPHRAISVIDFTRLLALARRGLERSPDWVCRTTGKQSLSEAPER